MRKAGRYQPKWVEPPQKETRKEKFERLATARVNRILTAIRLIGNLASTNYEWNDEYIEAIKIALVTELHETMLKFEKKHKRLKAETTGFHLPVKD